MGDWDPLPCFSPNDSEFSGRGDTLLLLMGLLIRALIRALSRSRDPAR
jgi:hypothetical protein